MATLEEFQLHDAGKQPLCLHTEHWRCPGLYLSNTCFAVHIVPRDGVGPNDENARDDLRALLRGLGQRLLEFNLWRPVVGVLETPLQEYQHWSKDQDWHRGDFLLWIETSKKDVGKRLADLLDPEAYLSEPELRQEKETSKPRNAEWFRSRLNEFIEEEDPEEILKPLVNDILPPPQPGSSQEAADKEDIDQAFDAWAGKVRVKADSLARGD